MDATAKREELIIDPQTHGQPQRLEFRACASSKLKGFEMIAIAAHADVGNCVAEKQQEK